MIEKRIIDGKSIFVNIIENPDGSITEQYFDDLISLLENDKNKELKEKLKKEKEMLRLEKHKLEEEKKEFKKLKDDQRNNVDILEDDPNYLNYCTEEQKEGYLYLKNNNLKSTRRDLKNLLASYRWKANIYPSIKKKKEDEEKRIREEQLRRHNRKKVLGYTFLTIGIILTLILMFAGCSYEMNNY